MPVLTKICTKCADQKLLTGFSKKKGGRDGRRTTCKPCVNAEAREKYVPKTVRIKAQEKIRNRTHKPCTTCKENKILTNFAKDKRSVDGRVSSCKECTNVYGRGWYSKNSEAKQKQNREWAANNKEKVAVRTANWAKEKRATDPMFRLVNSCRNRIYSFIKESGFSKKSPTTQMIGCSWEELKLHIESQFKNGMNWENYGDWHVDHAIPLSRASKGNLYQVEQLCHYTNLQPLWAEENLKKSDN